MALDKKLESPDMKYLLEPRGVAVFGASSKPGKFGYMILEHMVESGYDKSKIYPINLKGGNAFGIDFYTSLDEVKGKPVDNAYILVPAKYVFDSVKSCKENGVNFVQILSSGFSEAWNEKGEKEIVD